MSNVFQTCLKGFKLKKLVVKPKMAQPVEPDKEPIDPQVQLVNGVNSNRSTASSTDRGVKKTFFLFQNGCSIR